jgi:hypothetical protein
MFHSSEPRDIGSSIPSHLPTPLLARFCSHRAQRVKDSSHEYLAISNFSHSHTVPNVQQYLHFPRHEYFQNPPPSPSNIPEPIKPKYQQPSNFEPCSAGVVACKAHKLPLVAAAYTSTERGLHVAHHSRRVPFPPPACICWL